MSIINAGLEEYKANVFAAKSGIRTTDFKLFESAICPGYYGSKRFDRTKDGRVHTISLSSLLETSHQIPNLDYMHFFQVTKKLRNIIIYYYSSFRWEELGGIVLNISQKILCLPKNTL